jgi:hypothetical protein
VTAEADQPHEREHGQAGHRGQRHLQSLACARRREHEERQNEAGGDLDPDAGHERGGARAQPRICPGAQRKRGRQQQQDQRVVVGPADGQHEQHRVQSDERRRPASRVSEAAGRLSDQCDRAEARGDGDRLERPQAAAQPEGRRRVAEQREQRAVRGVLERPADKEEDRIAGRFGGDMRIRVQAVQSTQAREAEIAKHILGDQRRPDQQDHVRPHDRCHERAHRQRSRGQQHHQIARAHDQRERLKAARADRHVQAFQGARQPAWPAATASRDVLRGFPGGAGDQQEEGHENAGQADSAQCAGGGQPPPGGRPASAAAGLVAARRVAVDPHTGQGRSGTHRTHSYV